jgi:phage protein D
VGEVVPTLRPTFTLTIGGLSSGTDNPVAGPGSLVVDRDMDVPADALRLRLRERAGIAVGDEVSLALGHDGEEEIVFTGVVETVRPAISDVVVRALGRTHDLLNLRTSATYVNQSAGSIASDLIGQAGLSAGTVDDGPVLPRYVVDRALSAYRHLKELADRLGYELYTDRDGNIMFHPLGPAANLDALGGALGGALGAVAGALLGAGGGSYAFGQQLLGAAAGRRDVAWSTVEVGGESPMSGQGDTTEHWLTTNDADYRGSAGDGEPALLVRDPAARTKDLADRFAAGRLAVAARTAREVSISVLGRPQVDLGDTIAVADVPDETVNGSGYVRALRHRFGEAAGFVTEMRVSVEPES